MKHYNWVRAVLAILGASLLGGLVLLFVDSGEVTSPLKETDEGASSKIKTISFDPTDPSLQDGLKVTARGFSGSEELPMVPAQWETSDSSVAYIEGSGSERRVVGRSPGTALIVASVDGVKDSATVTVTESSINRPDEERRELEEHDRIRKRLDSLQIVTDSTFNSVQTIRESKWEKLMWLILGAAIGVILDRTGSYLLSKLRSNR